MMKEQSLQVSLTREELSHIVSRYHFNDADFSDLEYLYKAMQPLLCPKAYYEINPALPFIEHDNCVISVVTLGKHIDNLENIYSEAGRVSESYKIDCLSLTLLEKAYQSMETMLHEVCGLWINAYNFIGDKYPIEIIPEILDYSGQTEVTCNPSCMLQPKKSVIFVAELTEIPRKGNCNICSGCGRISCSNRREKEELHKSKSTQNQLSYGYQRIFGKRD